MRSEKARVTRGLPIPGAREIRTKTLAVLGLLPIGASAARSPCRQQAAWSSHAAPQTGSPCRPRPAPATRVHSRISDVSPRDLKNGCSPGRTQGSRLGARTVGLDRCQCSRQSPGGATAAEIILLRLRSIVLNCHPFTPSRRAYAADRCGVGKSTAQGVWQPYGTTSHDLRNSRRFF